MTVTPAESPVELRSGHVINLGHGRLAAFSKDATPVEIVAHVQQIIRVVGLPSMKGEHLIRFKDACSYCKG